MKDADKLVRAISQSERNIILIRLLEQKMNISELAKASNLDRATVSYHLGILEEAEIVSSEYSMLEPPHSKGKVGRYYTVNPKGFEKAIKALDELTKSLKANQKTA
jgi:DNA-binding transcriptional ArsR family regulator